MSKNKRKPNKSSSPAETKKNNLPAAEELNAPVTVPEASPPETAAAPPEKPKEVRPYYAGIDIVKILAVFLVISIHFFLYSGFYYEPMTDKKFMAPIAFRWIAYTCVPLFMTATGYLMKNKKFSPKFYLGLTKIIILYLFISLLCIHFRKEQFAEEFDRWKLLRGFLEFNNANYGWYINYYICIFLVIPFLNLAFNGLDNKWQRLVLVITVTLTTVFARSLFLGFERDNQIRLFPDYMNGAWPIAYYYAGAYIREHPPKNKIVSKLITSVVLVCTLLFMTKSSYDQSLKDVNNYQHFGSLHFNDYSTYPVFILAVCIFMLLYDIKTTNKYVKFFLRQISDTTLVLYMISYIFDQKNYNDWNKDYVTIHQKLFRIFHHGSTAGMQFNDKYPDVYTRWQHCFEVIGRNFLASLFWALIINNVYNALASLIKLGIAKLKENKSAPAKKTA